MVRPILLVVDLDPEEEADVRGVEAPEPVVELVAAAGVAVDRLLDRVPLVRALADLELDELAGAGDRRPAVSDASVERDTLAFGHAPARCLEAGLALDDHAAARASVCDEALAAGERSR